MVQSVLTDMTYALAQKIAAHLKKALGHLEYSYKKATHTLKKPQLAEDDLEDLEGFGARFARASDIAVQKFLRLKVLEKDPDLTGA